MNNKPEILPASVGEIKELGAKSLEDLLRFAILLSIYPVPKILRDGAWFIMPKDNRFPVDTIMKTIDLLPNQTEVFIFYYV